MRMSELVGYTINEMHKRTMAEPCSEMVPPPRKERSQATKEPVWLEMTVSATSNLAPATRSVPWLFSTCRGRQRVKASVDGGRVPKGRLR